jgi:PAS domain S-box-containing protein
VETSTEGMTADHQIILDSIADGVLTTNQALIITSFNRAAEKITGVPRQEAIGRKCFEVMRAEICESNCCLKQTMHSGEACENVPVFIIRADNKRIPINVSTSILRNEKGEMIGAVETFRDLSEIYKLRQAYYRKHSFDDIVSKHHKILRLFDILPQVAESHSTVLIEGPSGSGKELLARAIHNHGFRKDAPFIAVNCGALPDTLIESELFGYKAGAFTDAKKDKPGRFALADSGTIFLDEIGDITPATQIRLLRVLENRTFSPLGSTQPLQMKARVIAATHRDLNKRVEEKKFRKDLYYRINIVRLTLPGLAERKEDIPLLVNHFIERFANITGKQIVGISPDALAALILYDWPGNVRELENAIEHAFVLCRGGMLGLVHLPEHLHPQDNGAMIPLETSLKEIEKQAITRALIKHNWRRMAAARELGIDKNTLRRKLQRHGICQP